MNMGHGDKIFSNVHQNQMFDDALQWLRTSHQERN